MQPTATTTLPRLSFDCIDEANSKLLPSGYAFAYGWDTTNFQQYYGIVEVNEQGVTGKCISCHVSSLSLMPDSDIKKELDEIFNRVVLEGNTETFAA